MTYLFIYLFIFFGGGWGGGVGVGEGLTSILISMTLDGVSSFSRTNSLRNTVNASI